MIKQIFNILFLIPLLFLSQGCVTHEVRPSNPEVIKKLQEVDRLQNALMAIYRPSEAVGSGLRPTIVLNGDDLVNIGNGEVFVSSIKPGKYVFEMDDKKSGTEVTLKAGDEIYLKIEIVPGVWKGGGKLTQVTPQQGGYEAVRLNLISTRQIELNEYKAAGKTPEKTDKPTPYGASSLRR